MNRRAEPDFSLVEPVACPESAQVKPLVDLDCSYPALLASLAELDLLTLHDWIRDPISTPYSQDLLEILDDRYGRVSALVASQVPVADWFVLFPDPTLGDGILDRTFRNAQRLNSGGELQRKTRRLPSCCPLFL